MQKITKVSLFVGAMLVIALVSPLFMGPSDKTVTTASDEIRLTKGNEVKHPALSNQFAAWVEYRDGSYNIYAHNFFTNEEIKLNKIAVSSDVVGPVVYQNRVVWVDHTTGGWVFNEADVDHNTLRNLITENNQVYGLGIYEDYVVYSAGNGKSADVFVLQKDNVSVIKSRNLTNDDVFQKVPSIYGSLVAWAEYPTTCQAGNTDTKISCVPGLSGSVVTYDLISNIRTVIKKDVKNLSDVKSQNNTLAWSELEGSTNVVKVYYVNTGTLITVSPEDNHSYNPVLGGDSIVYFVSRAKGLDLDLYQFSTGKHSTLSWSNAEKSEPALGATSRYVAWIDNRLGTKDVFYYDSQATPVVAQNNSAVLDQDSDGLTDAQEAKLGSNQFIADTDNDGLTDGEEVNRYHTYPNQYDSDGDGISDGDEILYWSSNPLSFDSNNDGIDDKTSIVQGYNPMANRENLTAYRVQRMDSLKEEQKLAVYLRSALNQYLGRGRWHTNGAKDWNNVVNAYIYGGYNIKEIGAYVRGNKNAISFDKLATVLREEKAIAAGESVYSAMQ